MGIKKWKEKILSFPADIKVEIGHKLDPNVFESIFACNSNYEYFTAMRRKIFYISVLYLLIREATFSIRSPNQRYRTSTLTNPIYSAFEIRILHKIVLLHFKLKVSLHKVLNFM